ncbi:MAG: hypothetical protein GX321_04310 [Clostridiales bacterium]|nr:hypothetical protein [Clostridiales bacterium]
MKRTVKNILLFAVAVGIFSFIISPEKVQASQYRGYVPVKVVDELDNYPYPDMTTVYYSYAGEVNKSEFVLDSAGQIRVTVTSNIIDALRQKNLPNWNNLNSSSYEFKGYVWISTDPEGNNIVGELSEFSDYRTDMSWFLEKGKYYLCSMYDGNGYNRSAKIALLFEKANVTGQDFISSFNNSYIIDLNEEVEGFISDINPNDYYSFHLDEKATVTINYSFNTLHSGNDDIGYCGLYNSNRSLINKGTYENTDRGLKSFNQLLEPGTYYIKLNGMRGNTLLSLSPMYYDIDIATATKDVSWTQDSIDVNIETEINYSNIMVLYGDIKNQFINNDTIWSDMNENFVKVSGEATFTATDSGIYSVRITDKFGHNTMQKITISNIDITNPEIEGVEDGKSYNEPVTITWLDTQSGIDNSKTTLNGKKVKSGIKVSDEGKYTLKVFDMVGNSETITFYVDKTAPTINVQNGKTYNDTVTLRFKDNVSGIQKITIDNVEVSPSRTIYSCYLDGDYVVEIWDNADNYRRVEFSIKK